MRVTGREKSRAFLALYPQSPFPHPRTASVRHLSCVLFLYTLLD
jgi:hypothetical protein